MLIGDRTRVFMGLVFGRKATSAPVMLIRTRSRGKLGEMKTEAAAIFQADETRKKFLLLSRMKHCQRRKSKRYRKKKRKRVPPAAKPRDKVSHHGQTSMSWAGSWLNIHPLRDDDELSGAFFNSHARHASCGLSFAKRRRQTPTRVGACFSEF